ncbi:coiled-coil domain-containing protein 66 [Anguilla anguilla]|uniref:coiled-coil domain-containing protein 66 n=1 Tax=Anguilla anguilla TaxID=7936 RepID=UPI0015AE30F5|nr:coiled-coil domain-containing protein 66 [Anguilla anguilla]
MNLGDGLTFQLEDGKPKLILSTNGVQSKSSKKTVTRTRPQNVLKSKQGSEEPMADQPQRTREKLEDSRTRVVMETTAVAHKEQAGPKAPGKTASKANPGANGNSKACVPVRAPARAQSAKKTGANKQAPSRGPSKVTADALKESLVCLTQDQLQQILSTISQASGSSPQDQGTCSQPKPAPADDSKEESLVSEAVTLPLKAPHSARSDRSGRTQDERVIANGIPAGLFSTLGEREREKEALEAKRAQWKKELDEQMADRLQQKKTAASSLDYNPWARPAAGDPSKPSSEGAVERGEEERLGRAVSGLEERTRSTAQSYSSQQDLPAAIRSAFILGEASPVEQTSSAHKQEQQRRWLQDLEQQREENKLRRQQEKRELSQAEDHERWAMHFDSLQMRAPSQPAQGPERGERDTPARSATQQLSPSGALSVTSEETSPLGGDSLGRLSVDTTRGIAPRASYLRTMTSLLDPAQIEDRERKRLKQLEHQHAIEVQVEERRRQREREEALRRAEEQEEEQRLARERETLQEQYQLDALRVRQKQELHSRKTEELYLSVQRAQQEAAKDKQEQRIRKLARRGHDVSKLLHCMEEEPPTPSGLDSRGTSSLALGRVDVDVLAAASSANESGDLGTLSSRRDAAVQTDVGKPSLGIAMGTVAAAGRSETPDVPAEYRPPGSGRRHRREGPVLGKENVNVRVVEDGGQGAGGDPYEAFARRPKQAQRPGKRPEWNTHRPGKAFVPASDRYPSGLRRDRQDSRLRRQMELLTLVERNAPYRPGPKEPRPPRKPLPHRQEEHISKSPPHSGATHMENRGCSPPVPAIKHRLQQQPQLPVRPSSQGPAEAEERPPSSPFVPYVRTDEVYQLDPLAPLSRPPTQGSQQPAQPGADLGRPTPPPSERDPLLHPELLKNKERQQAILRGLSELRQGLLQKQRELETGLNPLLLGQEGSPSPHYQHM